MNALLKRYKEWANGNSIVLGWITAVAILEAIVTVLTCH